MVITDYKPDGKSFELLKAGLGPVYERKIKSTMRMKDFTAGGQHDSSEWVTGGKFLVKPYEVLEVLGSNRVTGPDLATDAYSGIVIA